MRSPKWTTIRKQESLRHRINSYRVLLSRCRAGQIIYVPKGNPSDRTRSPVEYDQTAAALQRAGCSMVTAEDLAVEAAELTE